MNKQETEDQHIVPKFYLKKFANSSGFVEVFDIEKVKSTKLRSYSSVCYGKYYYSQQTGAKDEIGQAMEEIFKDIENKIASGYSTIISSINSTRALAEEEMVWIASFMSMLWLRSEHMRQKINKMITDSTKEIMCLTARMGKEPVENLQKQFASQGKKIDETAAKETIKILTEKNYELNVDNLHHLQMICEGIIGFRNIFLAKKWRIYLAPAGCKFITSDTPVIEEFPKIIGIYGADIGTRTHYFPLTPQILIELSRPDKSGKHVKRKVVSEHEVVNFNYKRLGWSYKYAYSSDKAEFDRILTGLDTMNRSKTEALQRAIYLSKTLD